MRKIIQIEIDPSKGKIIALADDGSLWIKENEWFRLPELPDAVADETPHPAFVHDGRTSVQHRERLFPSLRKQK